MENSTTVISSEARNLAKRKSFFTLPSVARFLVVVLLLLGMTTTVRGQTTLPLTVAPARQQLTVAPGESTSVNVRFYNQSDSPVSGFIRVADFIVDNSEGKPRIIEEVEQVSPKFSGQAWFSLPYDRATIAANDKISFQAKIDVPPDANPGGRYIAVYFEPAGSLPESVNAEKEAGMSVGSRLASLIYIKVSGETTEKALVSRFFAPNFFEYGPIKVEAQILNRGDYHIRPRGVITLSNVFGGQVDQKNLKEENIFPDTVRSYENSLGQKWMLGKYKLTLSASYGEKGQALEGMAYVYVFPWRVGLVVALTLVIIILLASNFYKRFVKQEANLEEEIKKEKYEIEKLKEQLRKRG